MDEPMWIKITRKQADLVQGLADHGEAVDYLCPDGYRDVPIGSLCLADTSVLGWVIVLGRYRLRGDATSLRALCSTLMAGTKPSRLLAGRIRKQAKRWGVDGETPE